MPLTEFAALPVAIAVRDSKDRTGPALLVSRPDWLTFVAAVKHGDLPAVEAKDPSINNLLT